MKTRAFHVMLGMLLAVPAFADGVWTTDFEAAKKTAANENKSLLLEFTGSDWCPPCMALHKNVLSTETFENKATGHFVLVKLDFPNDTSGQTEAEMAQNAMLQEKYEVSGYPTILLADAQGRPYSRQVGYMNESAEDWTADLIEKKTQLAERDALMAKAAAAEGLEKAKLLDEALSGLGDAFSVSAYADTVKTIIENDPNNEAGLRAKYEGQLRLAELKKEIAAIRGEAEEKGLEDTVKRLTALLEDENRTGAEKIQIYYELIGTADTREKAVEYAKKGAESDPGSDLAERMRSFVERMEGENSGDH